MDRIVELILRTFSLLEAEGRAAKRSALDVVAVMLVWGLAAGLALAGLLVLLAALYVALETVVPAALAGTIVGGLALGLSAMLRVSGKRFIEERTHGHREE